MKLISLRERKEAAKEYKNRTAVLILCLALAGIFLVSRLYRLQILNGEEYEANYQMKIERERVIPGTRGRILDRNGVVLADNRTALSITIEDIGSYADTDEKNRTLNHIIATLLDFIKEDSTNPYGKVNRELPITLMESGGYEYTVDGWQRKRFLADLYGKQSVDDLTEKQASMTAEEIIEYLCSSDQFGIVEEDKERKLLMADIRYALFLNRYQKYLPAVVAKDVSQEAAAAVKESINSLPGVEVVTEGMRVYYGGESMSSILGYIGKIDAEELEEKEEEGYNMQSVIGKTGVEQIMEDTLRARDGRERVFVNSTGKRMAEVEILAEAKSGQDVVLSIDSKLQDTVYHILERKIADVLAEHIVDEKRSNIPVPTDASQVVITLEEVCQALFENRVVSVKKLDEKTEMNEISIEISEEIQKETEKVKRDLEAELAGETVLSDSYQEFFREQLYQDGILKEQNKEQSVGFAESLEKEIENGMVDISPLNLEEEYTFVPDIMKSICEYMVENYMESEKFQILAACELIESGGISCREAGLLLYEQGVLPEDEDAENLRTGNLSAYRFFLKKIENLELTPARLALAPHSASAVVTDPDTGEVLACVSYPGYDNNKMINDADGSYYNSLLNDLSLPLYNRALSQLTAPGSTFKPVTILAGISEGVITRNTGVFCDGAFDRFSPPMRCWNRSGHSEIASAALGIQNSCNDYMGETAYRLGLDQAGNYVEEQALSQLGKYAGYLSLDEKSGMELPESAPQVTDRYAIPSSIGQGTNNYTIAGLARYVCTLANDGTNRPLTIFKRTAAEAEQVKDDKAKENIAPEAFEVVKEGMRGVAANNVQLQDLGISSAGKTGTAEVSKTSPNHALFIGYAPVEDPEIALAVRIVNGYGSSNAVGVGADIYRAYFNLNEQQKDSQK